MRTLPWQMLNSRIVIDGEAATYSTTKTKPWQTLIAKELIGREPAVTEFFLEFCVSSLTRNGHPYDLDNLCVPVFSVLRQHGWFRGQFSNIVKWGAMRHRRDSSKLIIHDVGTVFADEIHAEPLFDGVYKGAFPSSGSDDCLATWLRNCSEGWKISNDSLWVELRYGLKSVNIGEIVSGSAKVKSVIDSLYPLLGGTASSPMDWKINRLFVEKGCNNLADDEIQITIYG